MAAFNEPLTDAEYDRVALMLARSERLQGTHRCRAARAADYWLRGGRRRHLSLLCVASPLGRGYEPRAHYTATL